MSLVTNTQSNEILVPISVGELLDKITILQIKSEQIKEPDKLKNIHKELSSLLKICQDHNIDVQQPLVEELRKINQSLWIVEDVLRDLEREKKFDDSFIKYARDVYFTNDKRAAVKKELNLLLGSTYVEEKSYKPYS